MPLSILEMGKIYYCGRLLRKIWSWIPHWRPPTITLHRLTYNLHSNAISGSTCTHSKAMSPGIKCIPLINIPWPAHILEKSSLTPYSLCTIWDKSTIPSLCYERVHSQDWHPIPCSYSAKILHTPDLPPTTHFGCIQIAIPPIWHPITMLILWKYSLYPSQRAHNMGKYHSILNPL